ncbi:DNA ligase [Catenovulum sediminis]|uniref:DNA ligase n=1 Tax=Catenovulum sediminis TaxID=1740262 RepID=A0ABV1RJW3_9ALTE|nr:DNA ligase [Catenovulum sediminis]
MRKPRIGIKFALTIITFSIFFTLFILNPKAHADPRSLLLAEVYSPEIDITDYYVSEKFDGIRAYWDGEKLWTRNGNSINAPKSFTQGFPNIPLDGELWLKRNAFAQTLSIIKTGTEQNWAKISYQVFDLPSEQGTFNQRLIKMRTLEQQTNAPQLKWVKQFKVPSHAELKKTLEEYIAQGAEGLMLHHQNSYYQGKRSSDLLKVKKYLDADATVIAYQAGKGKFKGQMGALIVKTPKGQTFKIGTGFTNQERANPPPIGSLISYKYLGFTKNGLPRFAVFLKVKEED